MLDHLVVSSCGEWDRVGLVHRVVDSRLLEVHGGHRAKQELLVLDRAGCLVILLLGLITWVHSVHTIVLLLR